MRRPKTNGFGERFNRTVLDEFFCKVSWQKLYESVNALQADLDEWLKWYNHERPHRGYRNMGKRSIETINPYLANIGTKDSNAVVKREA